MVNFDILFDELPTAGKQEKIISKYESAGSISRVEYCFAQFRHFYAPRSLLASPQGKGGWHIFEEVFLEKGKWYSFTLVSEKNALSLFLQKAFWRHVAFDSPEEMQAKDQSLCRIRSKPRDVFGGIRNSRKCIAS